MRVILDAFALIAALAGEVAAPEVEAELRSGGVAITAVNLAEVIDQLLRPAQRPRDEVEAALASLTAGGMRVLPVDEAMGRIAGEIRAAYYNRSTSPISMADCVALGACKSSRTSLATADGPLAGVARREGITVLALPNSTGIRP